MKKFLILFSLILSSIASAQTIVNTGNEDYTYCILKKQKKPFGDTVVLGPNTELTLDAECTTSNGYRYYRFISNNDTLYINEDYMTDTIKTQIKDVEIKKCNNIWYRCYIKGYEIRTIPKYEWREYSRFVNYNSNLDIVDEEVSYYTTEDIEFKTVNTWNKGLYTSITYRKDVSYVNRSVPIYETGNN